MSAGAAVLIGAAALAALALLGCESTQDKSAKLAKEGHKAFEGKGLVVAKQSHDVKVLASAALQDGNGAAAAVLVRNNSSQALAAVPISIDVRGAGGASVFKNNAAGLETSLAQVSSIPAHGEMWWVNDQVTPSGQVNKVKPVVGNAPKTVSKLPQIDLTNPTISVDPVSGIEASGSATNKSSVQQIKLIVYAVAVKSGKVVAAGRAQIARLVPGKPRSYHVFFIGDPRGAKLIVQAPPSTVQ